jgi:hypothetical protein
LSVPLKEAMKHWELTDDPLDLGDEPKKIDREIVEE